MADDRREFLKKLAKASVYSAPVVLTLATPPELLAQSNNTSSKGGMGMGMTGALVAPAGSGFGGASTAPWARSPGS